MKLEVLLRQQDIKVKWECFGIGGYLVCLLYHFSICIEEVCCREI